MALAYFLTFTTYGTWLHGTGKGLGSVDQAHNEFGTPFLPVDKRVEEEMRERMTQPAYFMDEARRNIACAALVELADEKGYIVHAAHVRSNHVHIVITADRDADRLMSDLKGRASRNLTLAGFENAERKRWTRHGSTKHLFRQDQVEAAIRYTLDGQGERMAVYDGRIPRQEPRTKEPRTK